MGTKVFDILTVRDEERERYIYIYISRERGGRERERGGTRDRERERESTKIEKGSKKSLGPSFKGYTPRYHAT